MQQQKTEWQLHHLSQALTRAKRLERKRMDFHKELYLCITFASVHLDESIVREHSHATDVQAIRIIEAKQRYERMIHKEYARHVRWQSLLGWVVEHDKVIMIRYFQKRKSVKPEIISRILETIEKRLEDEERRIEHDLDDKAQAEYEKYMKKTEAFRKPAPVVDDGQDGKRRYLIDGKFIYLTVDEYQAHQLEQEAARSVQEQMVAMTPT